MLMIIFLLSHVGIKSAIWINRRALSSFGTSEKKLSLWSQFFALFFCFFYFLFSLSPLQAWIFILIIVVASPFFTIWLRKTRSQQISARCLREMDRILLTIKSGQSLRQAFASSVQKEKSWFKSFLLELQKGFELHSVPSTESIWFNRWSQEILEVEKSRVKTNEQLEAIRRNIKVELDFKRKMKRVSDGPKMQAGFMSLLFISLNFLSFKSANWDQMKILLPFTWILFLLGIILSWCVLRFFKWKI